MVDQEQEAVSEGVAARVRPDRSEAPVFVVGCARSGTTLLYHMLLSAGGFAYYRAETHVYNMLVPRFGRLRSAAARKKLMDLWLKSIFYRRSGLDADEIRARVVNECRSGGDFLRAVMGGIADRQGVGRWSDCTPAHLLHMREIKEEIPNALFLHIIRDGRDVALSLERAGWLSNFPWDKRRRVHVAGLHWEWAVTRGRREARALASDYMEVSFEELVSDPRGTLSGIGSFVDHDLNYDHILENAVGSLKRPNTSFGTEARDGAFNPIGRWKKGLTEDDLATFEALVGRTLKGLGYELSSGAAGTSKTLNPRLVRAAYRSYFSAKRWAKVKTPLGRFLTDVEMLREQGSSP
ncbi:MAG: sulfotransferase [Gemmatimonadota bacterium]|nr:MAG: sulfotransferase [Gemmatimonadota bacterium]